MGYRLSTHALERRAEKKARIAAVKALKLKHGDWVSTHSHITRATIFMLDARTESFQWLRRATPKEIAAAEAKLEEQRRRQAEHEAYQARPDVRNAEIILAQGTYDLLKLGPKLLAQIVRRLREIEKD